MDNRVICINPLRTPRWMDFVARHAQSTIFHHTIWMSLLQQQYGYTPLAYCLVNEKGSVYAGIPFFVVRNLFNHKRLVSLPFTDHCFPLYNHPDDLRLLLEHLTNIQKEEGFDQIEIRSPVPDICRVDQNSNFVWHTLKITSDADLIFRKLKKQTQQCIHKAEREGVTVKIYRSKAGIDIFYKLQIKTRKRLGVPVQPKRFFDLLWKYVINNNMGFVVVAFLDNIPISSSVFLNYNSTVIYKYSSSDSNFWKLRANHLVLWKAIEWACLNGYSVFDFGKSEVNNTGLCKFKSSWGAIEQPLPYSVIPFAQGRDVELGKGSIRYPCFETITEKMIQNSPSFVCRITGELFYKYFG